MQTILVLEIANTFTRYHGPWNTKHPYCIHVPRTQALTQLTLPFSSFDLTGKKTKKKAGLPVDLSFIVSNFTKWIRTLFNNIA